MSVLHDIVFLFDYDNARIDNDRVQTDLRAHFEQALGAASLERYWQTFHTLRGELGYADYLGALQRYRLSAGSDPRLLKMSSHLMDYPFRARVYQGALEALAHCGNWGPTVIPSDGDVVFQPRKILRSGLWDALDGRVLIYTPKEQMLDDMQRRYPARHYVVIDDEPRILAAMKRQLQQRLTTVLPRQGRYALEVHNDIVPASADLAVAAIGELLRFDLPTLRDAALRAQP